MVNKSSILIFVLAFFSMACDVFDYSPHEITLRDDEKDIIVKGIAQVQQNALQDDTIAFVMTGDTQGSLDEVHEFVKVVNQLHVVDFILICGDLSNYGLLEEYRWLNRELKKLDAPYLPVIGNHDYIANGDRIFQQMFGPLNYTFEVGDFKFVAINTNSMEVGFDGSVPDLGWLKKQLQDTVSYKNIFVFSHVMPWSNAFDEKLAKPFADVLAHSKVAVSFHGHHHDYEQNEYYEDGVDYVITGSTGKSSFILVKIWGGGEQWSVQRIFF